MLGMKWLRGMRHAGPCTGAVGRSNSDKWDIIYVAHQHVTMFSWYGFLVVPSRHSHELKLSLEKLSSTILSSVRRFLH